MFHEERPEMAELPMITRRRLLGLFGAAAALPVLINSVVQGLGPQSQPAA
jgi:hypothetical protein